MRVIAATVHQRLKTMQKVKQYFTQFQPYAMI
jgi:hypothetical protein